MKASPAPISIIHEFSNHENFQNLNGGGGKYFGCLFERLAILYNNLTSGWFFLNLNILSRYCRGDRRISFELLDEPVYLNGRSSMFFGYEGK